MITQLNLHDTPGMAAKMKRMMEAQAVLHTRKQIIELYNMQILTCNDWEHD